MHSYADVVRGGAARDGGTTAPIDPEAAGRLAELFRLLGDPARVRILWTLRDRGEQCVGDLALAVDASATSVSQALRLLRATGVVRNRRDGRHVRYRLDDEHVGYLLEVAHKHFEHGRRRGR